MSVPDPVIWARFGITTLKHIFKDGSLLSFDHLKQDFDLPNNMFFRYLQLRHAVRAQFAHPVVLESHSVESFLVSKNADRILSSLYLRISCRDKKRMLTLYQKWQQDIPDLPEEDWEEDIQQYSPFMISARDRFI